MKNYISVIVLICFALLMFNCNKKTKNLPLIDLDADTFIYKHFNYKPGSYWIYRDSLNGRVDSFSVRSNYYIKQPAPNAVYNYHYITIAEHNADGTKPGDSSIWILNFQGKKIVVDYYYGRNGYGWAQDITFDPLVLYPYIFGDNNSNFDTARLVAVDSSSSIGGLSFYNVARVQQFIHYYGASSRGLTYIDDAFSLNDSVGFLKMKLYHPTDTINHVWVIQSYNVSKY